MIFRSKYKEYRLIIKPQRVELSNMGRTFIQGEDVQFKNFLFETENKEVIEYLKNASVFGVDFFEVKSKEEQEDDLLKKAEEIKAKRANAPKKKASVADAVEKAAKAKK